MSSNLSYAILVGERNTEKEKRKERDGKEWREKE